MEIDTTLEFLRANDLSKVNNIVLLHLSDGNSNVPDFQKRVKELAPIYRQECFCGTEGSKLILIKWVSF